MAGSLLPIAGLAASVFVGLVFLVAGIEKLRHRALLPGVIANYRLLPAVLVTPAALLLPPVELVLAVALLAGERTVAPLAAIALLLAFAAAMAINIGRGRRHIDCGCGHAGLRQSLGWGLVARNLAMAAALLPRLVAAPGLALVDMAVAALAGVAVFLLVQMTNAINALPARPTGNRA
ncbi:MauE/DoxX family redox-associated membrane protein [Sandarakinorhabdus sp. DWP1-3-1]|uniref:MauE/DoxX family redox-associated membrane protein n=1 Tax=Sandarakinorhabdus sp. DWP1-3-1 TaxID=2804627 RepID=UPI003CF62732